MFRKMKSAVLQLLSLFLICFNYMFYISAFHVYVRVYARMLGSRKRFFFTLWAVLNIFRHQNNKCQKCFRSNSFVLYRLPRDFSRYYSTLSFPSTFTRLLYIRKYFFILFCCAVLLCDSAQKYYGLSIIIE